MTLARVPFLIAYVEDILGNDTWVIPYIYILRQPQILVHGEFTAGGGQGREGIATDHLTKTCHGPHRADIRPLAFRYGVEP